MMSKQTHNEHRLHAVHFFCVGDGERGGVPGGDGSRLGIAIFEKLFASLVTYRLYEDCSVILSCV